MESYVPPEMLKLEGDKPMDALELLKKDHDRVKKLCTDANTYDDMKRLFEAIRAELEAHTHLEETDFYPQFENRKFLKELIQDARGQHKLVKELLRDMQTQDGQEFEKNFQTLKAEVQLYITAEESEIFPQVRSLTDGPNLGELADQLASHRIQYESKATT
jgi:hemerythrin superfamily protein